MSSTNKSRIKKGSFLRRNEEGIEYRCKKCDKKEECDCHLIIKKKKNNYNSLNNDNDIKGIIGNKPNENEVIVIKGDDFALTVFKVINNQCALRKSVSNNFTFVNFTEGTNPQDYLAILHQYNQPSNSYSFNKFFLFNDDFQVLKNKNNKFEVSYPFVPNNDTHYKDARSIYYTDSLKNLRVNIYNPDDPFFYDFCYPFVHNGKDVLIKDRRKDFFQQNSLCPVGCDSFKVDFSTKRVICECQTDNLDFSNKKLLSNFNHGMIQNNAIVVRCYNLVFHLLYMKVNVGTWIFLAFIFLALLTPSIFYRKELKSLPSKVPNEEEAKNEGEAEGEGEGEGEDEDEDEAEVEENDDDEVSSKCSTKASQCLSNPPASKPSHTKIKMVKPTKKLALKHVSDMTKIIGETKKKMPYFNFLNHLPFYEAVSFDQRSFLELSIDILKNQILSSKFSVDIISFKLLMLILNVCLCFGFNGLLFNEEYISQIYHNNDDVVNLFIKTQLPRVLYSSILSFIFYLIIHSLFSLKNYFTQLILAKKEESLEIISKIKKRLTVFTTIIIIMMIGIWYYISAFCAVYFATQNELLISSLFSVLFLFIFIGTFSLFLAFLRVNSLKTKSQTLFNFTSYFL